MGMRNPQEEPYTTDCPYCGLNEDQQVPCSQCGQDCYCPICRRCGDTTCPHNREPLTDVEWVQFTKRTDDPKLGYLESRLDDLGIPHRRDGHSFHGPILQVSKDRHDEAHALLNEPVNMGDGTTQRLDDLDDDDILFSDYNPGTDDLE